MAGRIRFKRNTLGYFFIKNYGVGEGFRELLFSFVGFNRRLYSLKLKKRHLALIKKQGSKLCFGSELKKSLRSRILRLITIKTYRGTRHKMKYPSRGQRTHTNGKTKKKFRY